VIFGWKQNSGFYEWLRTIFDEIAPDAFQCFLSDQKGAFAWYEKQHFGAYDKSNLGDLEQLSLTNRDAKSACNWDGLVAGTHHLLDGININISTAPEPGRWQVPLMLIPRSLEQLGLAHTGLSSYKKAKYFLDGALRSTELENDDTRSTRFVSVLFHSAVCAILLADSTAYDTIRSRLRGIAEPSGRFDSNPYQWAAHLYQQGKKNERWRINDRPVDRCLVHAVGYYRMCIDLNRELQNERVLAITLVNLGTTYTKLGENSNAEEAWTEARQQLKSIGDLTLQSDAEKIISECSRV